MINGFIEQTKELTKEEFIISGFIIGILKNKLGAENAITSKELIYDLYYFHNIKINDARIRKIINYIRIECKLLNLIATSKGYYTEGNQDKIDTYVESLYQRAGAIIAVAKSYNSKINENGRS